jgi:membrane protein YqaA with SNARE-associated domain
MVLAAPTKAWKIAFVCTVSSVLGGLAGYGIGYFLFESIGQPVVALYGLESQFAHFKDLFNEWGAWIVFSAGFSPIPYKVFTIASGVAGPEAIPLYTFIAASILGRGARFFILAALLYKFGAPIRAFIEKYLGWLTLAACILGFGGFVAIKML